MAYENPPVPAPSAKTLIKYGLTQEMWLKRAEEQGWVCAICEKLPPNGKLVTDHSHVKGFADRRLRRKLFDTAEKRLRTFRGLCCCACNLNLLPKGMTLAKARNIVKYLEAYENRIKDPGIQVDQPKEVHD